MGWHGLLFLPCLTGQHGTKNGPQVRAWAEGQARRPMRHGPQGTACLHGPIAIVPCRAGPARCPGIAGTREGWPHGLRMRVRPAHKEVEQPLRQHRGSASELASETSIMPMPCGMCVTTGRSTSGGPGGHTASFSSAARRSSPGPVWLPPAASQERRKESESLAFRRSKQSTTVSCVVADI